MYSSVHEEPGYNRGQTSVYPDVRSSSVTPKMGEQYLVQDTTVYFKIFSNVSFANILTPT
jgi:hypothetical protein